MADIWTNNLVLASLSPLDRDLIEPYLKPVELQRDQVLFEPGQDVVSTFFPATGTIVSLVVVMRDGHGIEAAMIGDEGAVGGIVSGGHKPASARMRATIGGGAYRIETDRIEGAKRKSASMFDIFSRCADLLLAQSMQSIACNAVHSIEQRCCRWLLATMDRCPRSDVAVTQEFLAEAMGVQRTSVSAAAQSLQSRNLIQYRRGRIAVPDRAALEAVACECYRATQGHFAAILPDVLNVRERLEAERRSNRAK